MKYHVSYTTSHDVNQRTQHETIEAESEAQVRKAFEGCQSVVITPEPTEIYGNEWEKSADQLHALATLDFNLFNTPHAVEEAYRMEGCGNDIDDLLAGMRG